MYSLYRLRLYVVRIYITLFLIFILITIAVIFGSQNAQQLTLNYFIARSEMTVASAVSLFTGLGFVLGLLFTLLWRLILQSKSLIANKQSHES